MDTKNEVIESLKYRPQNDKQASFIGRKNGSDVNLFHFVGYVYDMSIYLDLFTRVKQYIDFDYLIIEPYNPKQLDLF